MTDKALATTPQGGMAAWEPREVIHINAYPKDKYNLLVSGSMTMQVSPYMVPVVREVQLDPDPTGGDVYPITQKKQGDRWVASELGISAVGLANLGSTAGTLDIPQASGRVDSGVDPRTCTYRSTMAMRMPDGQWRVLTRECTVKLATIEAEIRDAKTKKGRENKNYSSGKAEPWAEDRIEAEIRKELLLKEKFLERLAETGAKSRTYRALMGIKTKYTPAEIARPFVIAQVVPDMTAPEVRERYLDQATSSVNSLFGPADGMASRPRALAAGPSPVDVVHADYEPAEEATSEDLAAMGVTEGQITEQPPEPSWMGGRSTDKPAAPPRHKLLALLQDNAGASILEGNATDEQLDRLQDILAGFGLPAVASVLEHAYGTKLNAEGKLTFTGAQAQAIVQIANNLSVPEFRGLWLELAAIAAAKGGSK